MERSQQWARDLLRTWPVLPQALRTMSSLDPGGADAFEWARKRADSDPSFAARLLFLANSAAMGSRRSVNTTAQALLRVGSLRAMELLLDQSLNELAPMSPQAVRCWEESVQCAWLMRRLSQHVQGDAPEPQVAYLGGLLHDIGRLLLLAHESRQREAGDPRPASETPAEELARHGMDHAELGALALRHWLVPEPLPLFVQWHHAEPASTPQVGAGLRLLGLLRDARTLLRCHDAGPAPHDWPQASPTPYRNDPHTMRQVARGALADARANLSLLRLQMHPRMRTG